MCVRWELAGRGVKNASGEHLVDPAGDGACTANHDTEKFRLNVKESVFYLKRKKKSQISWPRGVSQLRFPPAVDPWVPVRNVPWESETFVLFQL